ncbi:lef-11 [Cyclophragma undans nucleopolyhedrovirus]|uniref:Late expression factor 11 n=1 Tax=Cyclophragma undans nucleopolyhedrovirus TaxID=1906244 RepID=A0A288QB60_9ABAC|nr:lef-11 [Cyclophragma undans nucleopolyhedrovirus]AOT85571.1 lef-11 [Cyclophragma undans nucleopolyhedrovirus]
MNQNNSSSSSSSNISNEARCDHSGSCSGACLTRSELYALVRECINKRKCKMETLNIDAHMLDVSFEELNGYIRAKLSDATLITDKCSNRNVCSHQRRIKRILQIEKSLFEEYRLVVSSIYKQKKW